MASQNSYINNYIAKREAEKKINRPETRKPFAHDEQKLYTDQTQNEKKRRKKLPCNTQIIKPFKSNGEKNIENCIFIFIFMDTQLICFKLSFLFR